MSFPPPPCPTFSFFLSYVKLVVLAGPSLNSAATVPSPTEEYIAFFLFAAPVDDSLKLFSGPFSLRFSFPFLHNLLDFTLVPFPFGR